MDHSLFLDSIIEKTAPIVWSSKTEVLLDQPQVVIRSIDRQVVDQTLRPLGGAPCSAGQAANVFPDHGAGVIERK